MVRRVELDTKLEETRWYVAVLLLLCMNGCSELVLCPSKRDGFPKPSLSCCNLVTLL